MFEPEFALPARNARRPPAGSCSRNGAPCRRRRQGGGAPEPVRDPVEERQHLQMGPRGKLDRLRARPSGGSTAAMVAPRPRRPGPERCRSLPPHAADVGRGQGRLRADPKKSRGTAARSRVPPGAEHGGKDESFGRGFHSARKPGAAEVAELVRESRSARAPAPARAPRRPSLGAALEPVAPAGRRSAGWPGGPLAGEHLPARALGRGRVRDHRQLGAQTAL